MAQQPGQFEGHISEQTLFDDFARLNFYRPASVDGITSPETAGELGVPEDLLTDMVNRYVGKSIRVEELPTAREIGMRAIRRWESYNEHSLFAASADAEYADLRRHPQHTRLRYIEGEIFPFRRHCRGRIDGVDARFSSLVVRPPISGPIFFTRLWVRVIDTEGKPLVSAAFQ